MKKFAATIKRALLDIPLRRPSPDRIPRSGEAGMAINCYTIRVMKEGSAPLIVESADGNTLNCLEYDGDRYSIKSQVNFNGLLGSKFEFTHYHGLSTTIYSGWLDLAIGRTFRIPYVKAWAYFAYNNLSQGVYNRRKLVTKQRIDLLKVILDAQLNGIDRLSSLSVMSLIHTDKWYLHPNSDDQHHTVTGSGSVTN